MTALLTLGGILFYYVALRALPATKTRHPYYVWTSANKRGADQVRMTLTWPSGFL